MLELYNELEEEETVVFDGVEHVGLRVTKRYLRDWENPMEFYNEEEFRMRFRFHKQTVLDSLLPIVVEDLSKVNNRGLPLPPLTKLLIAIRFYATASYQVG